MWMAWGENVWKWEIKEIDLDIDMDGFIGRHEEA